MKIWFVGRRLGAALGVTVVLFFALALAGWVSGRNAAITTAAAGERDLPIYCVQKDENDKKLSISFDAAWGAYRLLKNYLIMFSSSNSSFLKLNCIVIVLSSATYTMSIKMLTISGVSLSIFF